MKYLAPMVTLILIISFIIPAGYVHAAVAIFIVNSLGDGPDVGAKIFI